MKLTDGEKQGSSEKDLAKITWTKTNHPKKGQHPNKVVLCI